MKKYTILKIGSCNIFRNSKFEIRYSPEGGQALFIAAIFFLIISLTVVLGVVTPVINHVETVRSLAFGSQSLYAAEAALQDVTYRLMKGLPVSTTETITLGVAFGVATTTAVSNGKEVIAGGNRAGFIRRSKAQLIFGDGAAFFYGLQAGEGGIVLENTAEVLGNAFANGPITGSGNRIKGDVVSAGPQGVISDVHATSSAYAHTIQNAEIDKDAYYQALSNTTVLGTLHPGSPDQATTSLPISDAQIAAWEAQAEAGGVISSPCPYKVTSDTTIGPKKIACDMEISGSPIVTIGGPLHVVGNINIKNTATVRVDPALGAKSVQLIADNSSNRTTSSKISIENSVQLQGSGTEPSYVLLLSQNESAERGGSETAIDVKNTVGGELLVYAGHGEILLQNTVTLKEVTAYKIHLKNSAEVHYESGLVSTLFTSGPGGGYVFDSWREVE